MNRPRLFLILATSTALAALTLTAARARDVPKVATGFVANVLCSETFVSGQDPDRIFSETTDAMPGAGLIKWALGYKVDRTRKDVTVTLLGLGRSHAVYRDGFGCYLDHGAAVAAASAPSADAKPVQALLPDIAGPSLVAPANPELAAALDRAFAEPDQPPFRHTRAVGGAQGRPCRCRALCRGLRHRYPDPRFLRDQIGDLGADRHSRAQGRADARSARAGEAWQGAGDVRHAITVDQLLRHTAGLALGSSLQASLGAALEPVNRMKFMEPDMAAYAESAELETTPGSAWNYSDGNTIILSHLIRNATGGRASDVLRFARRELFGPLGMRHVTLEFDASGNPEGSSQMLATARDWARFGMLYLNDGVAGGQAHPAGRMGEIFASPTANAWVGYGAGFWTNLGDSFHAAGAKLDGGLPGGWRRCRHFIVRERFGPPRGVDANGLHGDSPFWLRLRYMLSAWPTSSPRTSRRLCPPGSSRSRSPARSA